MLHNVLRLYVFTRAFGLSRVLKRTLIAPPQEAWRVSVWEGVGRERRSGPGPPPGAAARADPPTTWISRACRV